MDGGKAALTLPPLSLTFMQLGLIPGSGKPQGALMTNKPPEIRC